MDQNSPVDTKELFLDALELEAGQRRAFVDERTDGRPDQRKRVYDLLAAHAGTEPLFARIESGALLPEQRAEELRPGSRVGPYTIGSVLGTGGFGTVYLATQTEPVERRVALKVLRPGLRSDATRARFIAESQVLARMEHPGIAQVFDAGTAPGGEPYFVMEYVPGEPLTTFCDRTRLDLEGRFQLFESVCQAVAHAHQRGVVHRDLKPSNVLVFEVDGEPRAKVIDFGVAKAFEGPLAERAVQSVAGELMGTPAFMSPEQVGGELDLDTRADVYALGALLYEVLCGAPPFDASAMGFAELLRAIQFDEPERPSERHRRSNETTLGSRLPPDVDWIALKCLEKDRERRYSSASALAADVHRYLEGRPLDAAPPSTWYRACKLARRHRLSSIAATLVLLGFVTGVIGIGIGFVEARTQRDLATRAQGDAERQRDVAQSVLRFMDRDLLSSARPSIDEGSGRDVRLIEVIETAAGRLERGETVADIGDDPLVLAPIHVMVSQVFDALSEHERALRHVDEALAEYDRAGLAESRAALSAASFRAGVLRNLGRIEQALEQARAVLAMQIRELGEQHPDALATQLVLASAMNHAGQSVDAARKVEELAAALETLPEAPLELRARTYTQLGITASSNEDFEAAERYFGLALDLARTRYSAADPKVQTAVANLGAVLMNRGRHDVSVELFEQALEGLLGPLGSRDSGVLLIRRNLADARLQLGQVDEARAELEVLLRDSQQVFGPDHARTAAVGASLASCFLAQGDLDTAERMLRRAYEGTVASAGPDAREAQIRRADLVDVLFRRDRDRGLTDELFELADEDVASRRRTVGDAHPLTVRALANQAMLLEHDGQVERAEEIYHTALETARPALGATHPEIQALEGGLVDLLRNQGRLDEAEHGARQSLAVFESVGVTSGVAVGQAHARLAFVLVDQERFGEATEALEHARAILEPALGADDVWVRFIDQLLDEMP